MAGSHVLVHRHKYLVHPHRQLVLHCCAGIWQQPFAPGRIYNSQSTRHRCSDPYPSPRAPFLLEAIAAELTVPERVLLFYLPLVPIG
jgi:hypothetical protein